MMTCDYECEYPIIVAGPKINEKPKQKANYFSTHLIIKCIIYATHYNFTTHICFKFIKILLFFFNKKFISSF